MGKGSVKSPANQVIKRANYIVHVRLVQDKQNSAAASNPDMARGTADMIGPV